MSRAVSPSMDRAYGLARVARCWKLSRATVYRHRRPAPEPSRRPGPVGPCDDATLLEHIRKAISGSRFTGEGYRKIWARLRFAGIRSSPGRVRRLMRENGLLAPHRVRKRPDRMHDGSITTEAVDVMWGTDMTETVTLAEGVAHVFVAVDHCNSECVGVHADKRANRFQALEPVRQGVRRQFGAIGKGVAAGLKLRHDHGSNYMSDDFQAEIAFLGIDASPSFVRSPKATASPSASFAPSRRTCCGCATSRPSRRCAWRCSNSPPGTTATGWSPAIATGHPLRSGSTSSRPETWPHERSSRLSHNRGAVQ